METSEKNIKNTMVNQVDRFVYLGNEIKSERKTTERSTKARKLIKFIKL